jgi:hypothetical protein
MGAVFGGRIQHISREPKVTEERVQSSWTFRIVAFLLLFVAFVPHRFIYSFDSGITGRIAGLVPLVPVAVCAVLLCGVVFTRPRGRDGISSQVMLSIAVWIGIVTVGGLGSKEPAYALIRDVYYFLTGAALVFICRQALLQRHEQSVRVLVLAGALIGAYCVYEFATGTRPLLGQVFSQDNLRYSLFASDDFGRRVLGTVGHPVYLGTFFALVVPFTLWLCYNENGIRLVTPVVALVCVSSGLLLTFSRGAWFAAAVASFVYLRGRSRRQIWIAAGALTVVLSAAFSIDRVWKTLESRGTLGQIQAFKRDERGMAYAQATSILMMQPLVGVGTGQYRFAAPLVGDYNHTPDNMYLRMLSENGIAGMSGFAFVIASIVYPLHRAITAVSRRSRESDMGLAVIAGLTGFLADMLTCDALYFPLTRICFWIVAGLGVTIAITLRQSLGEDPS